MPLVLDESPEERKIREIFMHGSEAEVKKLLAIEKDSRTPKNIVSLIGRVADSVDRMMTNSSTDYLDAPVRIDGRVPEHPRLDEIEYRQH